MIKNYLLTAWRQFRGNKIYTFINLMGLTLGVCSCLVIWVIVHHEFSFDAFHAGKDRIYGISTNLRTTKDDPVRPTPNVLPPLSDALRTDIPGVEAVAPYYIFYDAKAAIPGSSQTQSGFAATPIVTTPEYFDIMKYEWLAGDQRTALSAPFKVVLSEKAAHKYFGSVPLDQMVDRELIYNDSLHVNVAGIVKDWEGNTDFPFTEFISLSSAQHSFLKTEIGMEQWKVIPTSSRVWVRLSKDARPDKVQSSLSTLFNKRWKNDQLPGVLLRPLSGMHFTEFGSSSGVLIAHLPTLYALMGIAALIFLLAIINYVNLATAQSIGRDKEIGIRKVLGSGRTRLVFQFLGETFLLTLFALCLAAVLTRPVIAAFHSFLPSEVKFHAFAPSSLLFMISMALVTTLLAGLYPARVLSSYLPLANLKGTGAPKGSEKWWLRKGLITFQFTIALIFITSTLIIGRQIGFMQNKDLGFNADAIVSFSTNEGEASKVKVLAESLRQLPGVSHVARQNMPPIGEDHGFFSIQYEGRGEEQIAVLAVKADENYLPLYGMKLLAGRNLLPSDTLKEFVINESLSKMLGFAKPEQALGKLLYSWRKYSPIVGVVADFHQASFRETIKPMIITSLNCSDIVVKLKTRNRSIGESKAIMAGIENKWKELYPHKPLEYTFLDESIAQLYKKEATTAWLMNIATGVSIFISCIGLFGLTMFTVGKRTREIGIRKVLGATVLDIIILISRDIVVLVLLAFAIASPIAWYFMYGWLNDFAYRISLGLRIFIEAGGAAILLSLITVSFQTIKAAVANPVKSLRTD